MACPIYKMYIQSERTPVEYHTYNTLCNKCLQILTMITLQLVKCYKYVRLIPSNVKYTTRACVWCIIIVWYVRKRGTEPPYNIGCSLWVVQHGTGFVCTRIPDLIRCINLYVYNRTLWRIPKHAHDLYIIVLHVGIAQSCVSFALAYYYLAADNGLIY